MTIPYIISGSALTFYIDSVPYQVNRTGPFWTSIIDELTSPDPDFETLKSLASPFESLNDQISAMVEVNLLPKGIVGVSRHGVTYNGELLHNALTDRMMEILSLGLDIAPWIRFMENLYQNPAEHAREELYLWLEKSDLPITSDGHFLAYKRVASDYYDIYSHTIYNGVGTIVEMPGGRQAVDPVRDRTCSRGLHFCSKSYLPHYSGSSGIVLVVKINPADVVSIPSDYDNAKGRTWKYEVVDELPDNKVTPTWDAPIYSDYDDDDDDDDYDVWEDDFLDDEDDDYLPEDDDDDDTEEYERAQFKSSLYQDDISTLRRTASKIALARGEKTYDIWKVWNKDGLVAYILGASV